MTFFFFFSECCDSQISLIQSEVSHTPFSQSVFLPIPIQLFWGAFFPIRLETTSDPPFPRLSSTIHLTHGGGGFTMQSNEIILQKNGRLFLPTPMWRSQDHFGKATFTLPLSPSVVALQRVSTSPGLFCTLPRGAPVCSSSRCPSLPRIKMRDCFRIKTAVGTEICQARITGQIVIIKKISSNYLTDLYSARRQQKEQMSPRQQRHLRLANMIQG